MSRQESLRRSRDTLTGEVPGNVIEENIRYYDEYIRTEAAKGLTEDEVIGSIGDPRLIAKTIMEAEENAREEGRQYTYGSYQDAGRTVYEEDDRTENYHRIDLSKWYWKLAAILVVIIFAVLVFGIITGVLSLLIPLMGPILMVALIFWIIRRSRE